MTSLWPLSTNLTILGVVALLLLSTPILRGADMHHKHGHDHSAHAGHNHGDMSSTGGAAPMQMAFEYGYHVTVLFASIHTDTMASYVAVLLGLLLLAVVHEGLTTYRRTRLTLASSLSVASLPTAGLDETEAAIRSPMKPVGVLGSMVPGPKERLSLALMHVLSYGIAYLLMLAVMSFNMGVFIAVLLGFGIGHYVFPDRPTSPSMVRADSCHGS
ncbi:hypothetical protein HYH03_006495 [Edaphochlamys debaryana]|uniref:Copper transport protein n=1 Tax=Edaphochlamys debaryana TaxID=47281 RepID=A0A836C155_9CHLO|nr:hypothetical protein HYH03_006495 [Edaphochlamys debaryana]|eukprot:KAG2495552.1 hypothetical protein HYH03_006495 [Edaphochlamys debaryana]